MAPLPVLLLTVTLLGGYAAARLHAACAAAQAELRASERRLDVGDGPARSLPDELRSLAEVAAADRDSRWRESAAVAAVLALLAVVLGIWSLTRDLSAYDAVVTVALALATVLVVVLLVLDGARASARLAAAVDRHPLAGVRNLEAALTAVDAVPDPARMPVRPITVARLRDSARWRASARRATALSRVPQIDVPTAHVVFPPGYAEGIRGLRTLLAARSATTDGSGPVLVPSADAGTPPGAGQVDDQAWEAALADLGRAAELDAPRRARWLSALAACAELRDDPPARESAARWALDAAAASDPAPRRGTDPRLDPLPDAVAVRPTNPDTWSGALRRAVHTDAPAPLLADVTVRWAYSLVANAPRSAPALLEPAVAAAVEISQNPPDGERYLELVRPGLERLGAAPEQMARLIPPRRIPPPPNPDPDATAVIPGARTGATAADPSASAVPPRDS